MTIDEIRKGLLQKLQQAGTQAQAAFWNKNNPVATGLLNLQKATPAYQQGGEKAFGKGYLYNNQGIQNYVPQIPAVQFKNPVAQTVSNFAAGLYNLPIQAGANTFAPIVNLTTDLGTNIGHKVLNQGATPYQHLKSPFSRLEYNALGQNNNTQQVVGNVAGAGLDILNMSTLNTSKVIAESAINNVAKNGFLEALKKGSLQGGSFMGAAGFFQGISDNRDAKTALEQFQKGGEEGAKGFLLGAVTGGLLSGSGNLFGKIFVRTPKVEQQLRDSQGRWTTGEKPVKPKGMAQAAWDFQLKFNKEYKRNPYTPVYPEDVKAAVKFELEKKGVGMSIRDVTKDENPLQTGNTAQSQVPTQSGIKQQSGVESPVQSNQPLSSEQILAKAEAEMKAATENIGGISSNESLPQPNVAQQPFEDIGRTGNKVVVDGFGGMKLPVEIVGKTDSGKLQVKLLADTSLGKAGEIKRIGQEYISSTNASDVNDLIGAIKNDGVTPKQREDLRSFESIMKNFDSPSSPQQPVGVVKVKPQAQIQAEVAGNLKSEPFSPTTSPEGQPLQSQPQLPEAVTTQPLQNQSDSLINSKDSSTNSIQRTVKDDFEAEMDAQIGKTFEKPFSGKSRPKSNTPTELPGDKSTTDFATARTAMGGGGIKGLPKESSDQFQAWVNNRRATELEGFLKKKEFKDLDNKGINGIFEFQSGNKSGRFGDVKKYFDDKYKTLQDNKIEFDYRQDYLPQLWNNSQDEINQVFGRKLGTRPSFTIEALFKSYQEGIDAGLKPKFNNISDLVGWYEQKANKALADKKFFDYLGKDGQILPSGEAPQDWVTLNPDNFPKFLSKIGDEKFAGTYKAPKELADVINNYLQGARLPFLEKVANYVSRVKNITLNFGIPGTGINMHGINILARHTLMGTGGNPVSRFITGGKYMIAPNLATKELNKSLVRGPQAIKNGLSLSAEDYSGIQKVGTTFAQKFGKKWDDAFGAPLFEKMIPALKLSSYEELVKNGMEGKDAAKLVNNVYGGINWEQMGRGKDFQNLLRAVILAPDWAETTLRLGGNLAKSANLFRSDKVSRRYQTMMATILASYVAHNVVNKLTSGHYSYENEPSNMFNIQLGYTDDGEKRYLRPYGTGLDMVRLPVEIAMGLAKGDLTGITRLVRNRLSIPAGVAVGTLTDQDYRGNAIGYRGTDKYGNQMPIEQRVGNITSEMASLIGVPAFTRQLYRGVSGQQSPEASLTQGIELPFRYQGAGNSKTQNFIGDVAGVKGKDLYDLKKRFQGEAPFSDKQKAMINQGGMPALEAVMNQRIITRQLNQIKDIQKKAASGEITPEEAQKAMQNILKQPVNTPKQTNASGNQAYAAENGVFEYNNKYSYISPTGKTTTVDINPPTKGNGIDAFVNSDWNITKAREVWNSQLPQNTKDEIFKKLGVDPKDVRYDALANHNTDVSTQYLLSKSPNHEVLLHNILTGRKESISGKQFASNGVIDNLVEQGQLSKEEGKQLKALKFDKNGQSIGKSTSSTKKGKKATKLKVKKANFKIPTKQSNAKTIKSGKPTIIKAPKVSFATQFSKNGAVPKARKYQVKFNV